METRTRARRVDRGPPEAAHEQQLATARRATRSTRQPTRQDTTAAISNPTSAAQKQAENAAPMQTRGSLVNDPVPRRGVRDAPTELSIATDPQRPDDASDEDDMHSKGDFSIGERQGVTDDPQASEGNGQGQEAEEALRQVMILSVMDLAKASTDLVKRLQNPAREGLVSRGLLRIKRNAFFAVREIFESPSHSPFAEWSWLDSLQQAPTETTKATTTTVLVLANLVTALDVIDYIKSNEDVSPLPFLEKLDDAFPKLFALPGSNNQYPELALAIRTVRWIETLAVSKDNIDPRDIVVSIFCEPTNERNYTDLFNVGPFRSLGGLRGDAMRDMCSDRITKLFRIIMSKNNNNKIRKAFAISEMRSAFPLDGLFDSLREWLFSIYLASVSRLDQVTGNQRQVQFDEQAPHDADGDVAESVVSSVAESQPIVRAAGAMAYPPTTLFHDVDSVRQLNMNQHPPSHQQHGASQSRIPPQKHLRQLAPRPSRDDDDDDYEDDDEDDGFETDHRIVDNGKRAAIAASLPPPKRPRVSAPTNMPPPPLPHHMMAATSSSPAPSATPLSHQQPHHHHHHHQAPSSSAPPDLHAVQRNKSIALQNARHAHPITYKQRHVWTDRDAAVLIDLVARRRAAWAVIDREDGGLFEMPRNAQAYRDKARNMKVDFLITDSVLPAGFDLVTLGKKEVERLMRLGKNPSRMEEDLDENGRPINTEFRYGMQAEQ